MTIKEIIWLGGLPQLGRLPLLSGVSRVHVNKPLVSTIFTTPPDIGSFFFKQFAWDCSSQIHRAVYLTLYNLGYNTNRVSLFKCIRVADE